jgi:hypothetical protein
MIRDIARVLQVLHGGALVEVRALGIAGRKDGTWSGYFTDYTLAAQAALECEKADAAGVYVTLNTIHPGLFARSPNQLHKHPKHTTTNNEVITHRWLLVDVDPKRPTGISSTNAELGRARRIRNEIKGWLHEQFPEHTLVTCCSGNGYHALLQTDLGTEDKNDVLAALNAIFGEESVSIDQSVGKPAQLTKLYGTWARKGFSIPDRPHRQSYIEEVIHGQTSEVRTDTSTSGAR